jgi:pyruvate dehydrogenase E2 component (dihydrolipoamide acetyltransferase)
MTDFRMPSLGADMDEGKLVEWLKRPGDKLKRGDIIAVVETQKGAIEIEVFHDGVLEHIHAALGATLPVGSLLATIRTPGETLVEQPPQAAIAISPAAPAPMPPAVSVTIEAKAQLRITPAARASAALSGIDLAHLHPGSDGIIGLREIAQVSTQPRKRAGGIDLEEMRKAIAAAMARSKREIPHYYVTSALDITAMTNWLSSENAKRPVPERILSAVPVIKACALALHKVPEFNGHYLDDRFTPGQAIKMGIGIALRGGGLIAPAIDNVDALSLDDIMRKLSDLAARVRGGRLRSSELTDATVTISNLGDNSADAVLPVIYPPQVAIIGVGQIAERPWIVDGALVPRKIAAFTVAGDHRANDGRLAARYLKTLEQLLQKPEAL